MSKNPHQSAEQIVLNWFYAMTDSVRSRDLDQHMQLISKNVRVYGLPNKDVVIYKEWKERRQNEFTNEDLLALNYQGLRIISSTARRIRFNVTETMVGKQGKMIIIDKNIILENEDDNDGQHWRVVEENINDWQVKKLDLARMQA